MKLYRAVPLALVLVAALALSGGGARAAGAVTQSLVANWDASSATMTFALFDPYRSGANPIITVGSSTTVTAVSGTPFDPVNIGDELFVTDVAADQQIRYITAKASGASVTVNSAVNWSTHGAAGFGFSYRILRTGTGVGAAWFNVGASATQKTLYFGLETINATSIAVRIECITGSVGATPTQVYPPPSGSGQCQTGVFTTAGLTARCAVLLEPLRADRCRFGAAVTADVGVQSIHAEYSAMNLQ